MKRLFLLLFLCGSAWSQPASIPGFYGDFCCTDWARRDNGWHIWWYTRRADNVVISEGLSCKHGACVTKQAFMDAVDTLHTAADPVVAVKAAWPVLDCATEPALCNERIAVRQPGYAAADRTLARFAPAPQTYTHSVKVNGTTTTRPAYLLVDGVRGTKEAARATVGQPCDLTKPKLASGSDWWASYGPEFVSGRVALCSK